MASELSETVSSHIVILSKGWLSQRQSMATLRISKGAVHGSHHQKILHLKYTINMINKAGRQSAKVLLKKEKGFTDKSKTETRDWLSDFAESMLSLKQKSC